MEINFNEESYGMKEFWCRQKPELKRLWKDDYKITLVVCDKDLITIKKINSTKFTPLKRVQEEKPKFRLNTPVSAEKRKYPTNEFNNNF